MKRRALLLAGAGAAGALVVGWGMLPPRSRLGTGALMTATEGDVALNGWIKIRADGSVVLAMPRSEMGQGVHTALAMLAAEELDVPLEMVRAEQAGADGITVHLREDRRHISERIGNIRRCCITIHSFNYFCHNLSPFMYSFQYITFSINILLYNYYF